MATPTDICGECIDELGAKCRKRDDRNCRMQPARVSIAAGFQSAAAVDRRLDNRPRERIVAVDLPPMALSSAEPASGPCAYSDYEG